MPNPYIDVITLPSGNAYDIVDSGARALIAALNNWDYIVSTNAANTPYGVQWDDDGTTITGTLVASADTKYKIYLVPTTDASGNDEFSEYITISKDDGVTYQWEKFGSIEVPDLSNYVSKAEAGDLAYKDSASGSFTPSGTVSQPTFTGSSTTSTGKFTPSGSVSLTNSNQSATVAPAESGAATYTPTGSVSAPTISVESAGATTTVNSITAVGTLPELTTTVSNGTLTIGWSAGTLPTKGSNTTVKTGDASYSASAPSFTGTGVRLVTDDISVPSSASFSGTEGNVSVTGTPSGTVSQPSFTGTADTVTVS